MEVVNLNLVHARPISTKMEQITSEDLVALPHRHWLLESSLLWRLDE